MIFCENLTKCHFKGPFCGHCIQQCKLCGLSSNCKDCLNKCYYKNCQNYLCNKCMNMNLHQKRSENTDCRFFTCEGCKANLNCIMTTAYCTKCEKRICAKCYQGAHKTHI